MTSFSGSYNNSTSSNAAVSFAGGIKIGGDQLTPATTASAVPGWLSARLSGQPAAAADSNSQGWMFAGLALVAVVAVIIAKG